MSAQRYKAMARKHWSEWLPERVKELKADGILEQELTVAGMNAQSRVLELMQQGYKAHEAEEVALSEYILLPPEPPPEDDWEAEEIAEMEREYRAMRRDMEALHRLSDPK